MPKRECAHDIVEAELGRYLDELEKHLGGDVLVFYGPITYGMDDEMRDVIEAKNPKQKKLFVILETDGGFIEVAERMANTFRQHYTEVDFIVPNHAMSAGTVLVMSGDDIHMDYYSILGPIDPQVADSDGHLVPALGYLHQFEMFIAKDAKGELSVLESAYFVQKFDPAQLYRYGEARDLSIKLLQQWLVQYKFKNWSVTETSETEVTEDMKRQRAKEIGEILNDTKRWHSHSRGISMATARRDLRLVIKDFGEDTELNDGLKRYCNLLTDHMRMTGQRIVLQDKDTYTSLNGN